MSSRIATVAPAGYDCSRTPVKLTFDPLIASILWMFAASPSSFVGPV